MKNFLFAICAATLLLMGCGGEKSAEQTAPSVSEPVTQAEQKNYYSNGEFKVGTDIAAGEYLAVGTGYAEVTKHLDDGSRKIIVNDNLENSQRYFDVQDGDYIKVPSEIKLYPSADAPKIDPSGGLITNHYKVGTDISPGEYKITLEPSGYFEVTQSTRREGKYIVKNQFAKDGGSYYATVADGQYLQIKKGTGEFIVAAEPKVEQPVQKPAPVKVLNLGMTLDQFKAAYNTKIAEIAPETGWNINAAQLQSGDVQDVFMIKFTENVIMMGTIDKSTRAVKEVMITAMTKTADDAPAALLSYGLVLATLNPELNAQRRLEVFDALKLTDGKISDLWNSDGTILLGNVRYRTKFDKQLAIFYFTASAKDL